MIFGIRIPRILVIAKILLPLSLVFSGCAASGPSSTSASAPTPPPPQVRAPRVMLGIDVLEQEHFAPLRGKRIGLLTHPAGANRYGVSAIDVIRRDPANHLVALFGPEHGIYGNEQADQPVDNQTDARTGLPVYSLYGRYRKPTPAMLKNIDVMVIDLQDIGVRSYTFVSCMLDTIEACFENHVEVVVLDRPDPLGGLKVAGPMIEKKWKSYVGSFPVPYVHGMTIGELARMAVSEPGILNIPDSVRKEGKLIVIPMRGWRRDMLWPQTGLKWIPTSPYIPNFEAVIGYAMTGLGAQIGGFRHGIGTSMPFRLLTFKDKPIGAVERLLRSQHIPGIRLVPTQFGGGAGPGETGLYVQISNWATWDPTELSFYMMKDACVLTGTNPFRHVTQSQANLFNKHVGSTPWWNAITHKGAHVDVRKFVQKWDREARAFQRRSEKYWFYQ